MMATSSWAVATLLLVLATSTSAASAAKASPPPPPSRPSPPPPPYWSGTTCSASPTWVHVRNMMYDAGVPWKLAFYPPGTSYAGNYSALNKFGIPYNASLPMYTNNNPAEKHCVWWSVNSK